YLSSLRTEGGLSRPAYPPRSTILLSSPLKGDSSGTMAVDALYTSLTQFSAFEAFRDAMIGLASFLALAALLLAIVSGSDMARNLAPQRGFAGEAPSPSHRRGSAASGAAELAAAAAEYQYETLSAADAEKEDGPTTGIAVKEVALPAEEGFDIPVMMEEPVPAATAVAAPTVAAPAAPGPRECDDEPAGLYSPSSGLGWESYMKDRLDAEISRSASFEQDLSLLVICYDGLTSQDANYEAIGDSIERFFSFRDLSFERG